MSIALILIVDDEASILALLQELLEDEDFTVVRAGNGREALAKALLDPPNLIVTDLMMPIMDGRALAQALHDQPSLAEIPILLISAAYTHQADDSFTAVLPKPFSIDQVLASITQLLL